MIESSPLMVSNNNEPVDAPVYDAIQVPRYTSATLNPRTGTNGNYKLYSNPGSQPLQQNVTGIFTVPNITNDTAVYIQKVQGSCSSSFTRVEIKVVDRSYFAIPNAFTPNGDGRNDRLNLRVIGSIEVKYFRIFNQFGELVFQTNQVNSGWDGTVKGVKQNTGTFVWAAEGKDLQ